MNFAHLKPINVTVHPINVNIDLNKSIFQLQGVTKISNQEVKIPVKYIQTYDTRKYKDVPGYQGDNSIPYTIKINQPILLTNQNNKKENCGYYLATDFNFSSKFKVGTDKGRKDISLHFVWSYGGDFLVCANKSEAIVGVHEIIWKTKPNRFDELTYEYVGELYKEVNLIKTEIQEMKSMLIDIYHLPGMPGDLLAQKTYNTGTKIINKRNESAIDPLAIDYEENERKPNLESNLGSNETGQENNQQQTNKKRKLDTD